MTSAEAAGSFNVAVVGSGARAAELLRLLLGDARVGVKAVCAPSESAPVFATARELGVPVTLEIATLSAIAGLSLVIDMSEDPASRARLEAVLPPDVQLAGPAAAHLLAASLAEAQDRERARIRASEARSQVTEFQRRATRLQAGHDELERENDALTQRLAETYFIHEYFRALSRARDVDDVCSIIVDGASGLLGVEVAAVYVAADRGARLELRGSQGRVDSAFSASLASESLLAGRSLQLPVSGPPSDHPPPWIRERLSWQTVLPLRSGREVHGALALGGTAPRDFGERERARFETVAEQSGLALANAILHEELETLAVSDRMTGLYNHAYGTQRLDEEVKRAARFGHTLAVMMLDLDDFKSFNDAYGHPAGDALLAGVAGIIRRELRDMDIAVRYGGEEFMVILPETSWQGAVLVAERIRGEIERLRLDVGALAPAGRTVSAGIAEYPADATSGRGTVEAADRALYRAKEAGKNRVESA